MFVDFQNSFISWLTPDGSFGKFNAEAVLNYNGNEWVLGSEVIACDVYGKGDLFKNPYYYYQPLFSKNACKIFRTFSDTNKTNNTEFEPSAMFQSHTLTLNKLTDYAELNLASELNSTKKYQCIINTKNYTLQFPVKHLNIKETSNSFQVETGPVAFPLEGTLNKSYIAFNTTNSFEALVSVSVNNISERKVVKEKNCEIKIISAS